MTIRVLKMAELKWLDQKEIAAALERSINRTAEIMIEVRARLDEMTAEDGIERYRQVGRSYLYDPIALELAKERQDKPGRKPKRSA
jgi:hypothetical protein